MTHDMSDYQREQIIDALYAGRKIEAIKIYRQATYSGLAEAKEFIEQLESRLREETPEKITATSRQGCGTAVLIVILAALLGGGFATFVALNKNRQPVQPAPVAVDVFLGNPGPQQPVNLSDPAATDDPAQEGGAPFPGDLAGGWRLSLPAGFEHPAELERVDDAHYRLRTVGMMNGVYQLQGNRLVMETPVHEWQQNMWKFRWQIEDDHHLRLVGQPQQEKVGANYLGATLTKADR